MNAAGMRTLVLGAVGLLCLGALCLGTSGGRELVVAVVVVGPTLTVAVAVVVVAVEVELVECAEPPQPAISSDATAAPERVRRDIGAL